MKRNYLNFKNKIMYLLLWIFSNKLKKINNLFENISFYEISSFWIYKKNKAILNAGKIIPTIGTKIDGKKAAAIINSIL